MVLCYSGADRALPHPGRISGAMVDRAHVGDRRNDTCKIWPRDQDPTRRLAPTLRRTCKN